MTLSLYYVVFDCDYPVKVGRFWAAALGRELVQDDPERWVSLPGDPKLWFNKVLERKTTKNRVHLDWHAPDREAEVQRLIGLSGARLWDMIPGSQNFKEDMGLGWTTMADPEGNEFCVVQAEPS